MKRDEVLRPAATRPPWVSPKCATTACNVCPLPAAPARAAGRAARSGASLTSWWPDVADRPARQQRVAVLAVARDRAACGRRRRSPRAPGSRPAPCSGQPNQVRSKRRDSRRWNSAHLLQEHEVGVERLDAEAEVVDLQPLARADAPHTLVDVSRWPRAGVPSACGAATEARAGGRKSAGSSGGAFMRGVGRGIDAAGAGWPRRC